jgi:hypothetical protein
VQDRLRATRGPVSDTSARDSSLPAHPDDIINMLRRNGAGSPTPQRHVTVVLGQHALQHDGF